MTDPAQGLDADKGRVVLITGAGNGLGRAFALGWAARGACVVVNNRRRADAPSSADAVVAQIRAAGGQAIADYCDVRDPGAAEVMIGRAVDGFGKLDAVILNAGVTGPAARVEKQGLAEFQEVMDINLWANIPIIQAALPHLKAAASGRLLLIASSAGLYGVHGRGPYAASKGALIALGLTLALELKRDGIGVNLLAPYAATQMTPAALSADLGDTIRPEMAAPMALWLTSARCEATGQIWSAGAGYMRRAEVQEGLGGGPSDSGDLTPEWIGAHLDRIGDMTAGQSYPNAEAAFADMMQKVQAAPSRG